MSALKPIFFLKQYCLP